MSQPRARPRSPALIAWQKELTKRVSAYRKDPEFHQEARAVSAFIGTVRFEGLIGIPDSVFGISIRPLTLRDFDILEQIDHPLVAGGDLTITDCVWLVWYLSPHYREGREDSRLQRLKRRWINHRLQWNGLKLRPHEDIIAAVHNLVDKQFVDAPGRGEPASSEPRPLKQPWSLSLSLADPVLRAYRGFTYEGLCQMPLARFWQHYHMALEHLIEDYRYRDGLIRTQAKFHRQYEAAAKADLGPPPDSP